MKRWMLPCGTLLLTFAALVLAACSAEVRNPFAHYPGYDEEYAPTATHERPASGAGYAGAGAPAASTKTANGGIDELWIVPTDVAAGTPVPATPTTAPSPLIPGTHDPIPGSPILAARQADGHLAPMPLQHTDISATITGYIASVGVSQQFSNPYTQKIEAVYVFPLPENAGINAFVMTIGDRHIRGIIRERADAEKIYKLALAQGFVASLMTQERPNIFAQNVANIEPGKKIDIQISYFHTLAYRDGWFEWTFPMVVGAARSTGFSPAGSPGFSLPASEQTVPATGNTVDVGAGGDADPSSQKPETPSLRPDQRSGQDISLKVTLNAGVPIEALESINHKISEPQATATNANTCTVELATSDSIPNKDFILRYKAAGDKIKTGMFLQKNKDNTGGWFTALLIPPESLQYVAHTAAHAADSTNPPSLADINFQFAGMQVSNIYPQHIPALFVGKPIIITGRYTGTPSGSITITGRAGDQPMTWTATAKGAPTDNPAIATIWASAKLADLRRQAIHEGRDVTNDIKSTALEYGIMSEFTNFVAVDTTQMTDNSTAAKVTVP